MIMLLIQLLSSLVKDFTRYMCNAWWMIERECYDPLFLIEAHVMIQLVSVKVHFTKIF